MNLHPLLTHFPVALLTIYSLLELIKLRRMSEQSYWFYIKACLVILGTVIGYATFFTGYIQKDEFTSGEIVKVVNAHFYAAISTLVIFTLLSIGYGISWLQREGFVLSGVRWQKKLLTYSSWLLSPIISFIMVFLGLTAITITGALGGALAYGRDVDPFVNMMYKMLIK